MPKKLREILEASDDPLNEFIDKRRKITNIPGLKHVNIEHFITEALDFRVIKGDNQTVYRILHPKGEEHGYQDVVISHSNEEAAVPVANFELKNHVGKQPPKFGGAKAIGNILNHFKENNPHVKEMYAVAENPEHKEHFQRILSGLGYKLTNKGFKFNKSTVENM